MSHLSPERLAALADDTPTPIEAQHVTTCAACSAEIAAQRRLSRLAVTASMSFDPPVSRFDALLPRLRAEGLAATPDRGAIARRWGLRAATAIGFVALGALAGRWSAGGRIEGAFAGVPSLRGNGGITGVSAPVPNFRSQDEAMQAMMASQQAYENAATFLAAQDTSQRFIGLNSDAYRTRLAALDEMTAASRAALYRAPQDPLLNQYYLAFQSAREQTLRELVATLPASRQVGRY
ncbi:MAG: hypothetical protein FJ202_01685 [Gemmatimonadetes bacterium]|nr:hypothetical protein [Gemmatimonadota bacterium]